MVRRNGERGAVLLLCIIFLVIFSALAAAMASFSGTCVQIAHNHRKADNAYRAAESGLEIMRYWIDRFVMPKTTPPNQYLATIVTSLQNDLQAAGVNQIVVQNDGSIPAVSVDAASGSTFTGQLQMHATNPDIVLLSLTGADGQNTRTIQVAFNVAPYEHPIFNYGMATKGAIQFPQNPTITGAALNWEADVYVDTDQVVAVNIGGNANFDGDFYFRNAGGQISYAGTLQIAGEFDQAAIDNHVLAGAEPVQFPAPDTAVFAAYASGPVVDPAVMDLTKGVTLTNATIPAGTNPTFGGTVTIQGVLLIESPNVVTFSRNCQVNGVIVGAGDILAAANNQINFNGNFATGPYPVGDEFGQLSTLAGTSILAPGFGASFTGNFSAIDGVVAVSGLEFAGNASADIRGTLINYGESPTVVDGNIALNFNRASSTKIPGGFDTHRVLAYDPQSYSMVF